MKVDKGNCTPSAYTVNGGIAGECKVFYSRLAPLLSIKDGIEKPQVAPLLSVKVGVEKLQVTT